MRDFVEYIVAFCAMMFIATIGFAIGYGIGELIF